MAAAMRSMCVLHINKTIHPSATRRKPMSKAGTWGMGDILPTQPEP